MLYREKLFDKNVLTVIWKAAMFEPDRQNIL